MSLKESCCDGRNPAHVIQQNGAVFEHSLHGLMMLKHQSYGIVK